MTGKLYFVATPIGNMKDITERAIETLNMVDIILCEDTRHSLGLFNALDIKKPLMSFHKFNYKEMEPKVIKMLQEGKNIALVSDAGMPCISDPGSELIPALIENGLEYTIIPGACAFVSAFALSGMPAPFTFVGFLPDNKKERKLILEEYKNYKTTLIFYISPHSLKTDINDLFKAFGDRQAVSVRELTKIHEEVEFFNLKDGYPKEPRGEYVLLIEGNTEKQENTLVNLSVEEHFNHYINTGFSKQEAIKQVAKDRCVPKNEIYKQFV